LKSKGMASAQHEGSSKPEHCKLSRRNGVEKHRGGSV